MAGIEGRRPRSAAKPEGGSRDPQPTQADVERGVTAAEELLEQRAGEQAFAAAAGDDEGQAVEVSIGDKLFQPLSFTGVRIGPFKAATVVCRGETVASAMLRLHAEMSRAARVIHERETEQYAADLAKLIRDVKGTPL